MLLAVTKSSATNNLARPRAPQGSNVSSITSGDYTPNNSNISSGATTTTACGIGGGGGNNTDPRGGVTSVGSSGGALSGDRSMSEAQQWRSEYTKRLYDAFVNASLRTSLNVPAVFDDASGDYDDSQIRESDMGLSYTGNGDNRQNSTTNNEMHLRSMSRGSSEGGSFFGFYDNPSRRFQNVSVDKPDFGQIRIDNFSQDNTHPPVCKCVYIYINI